MQDQFKQFRTAALFKDDKSYKGSVDKRIVELCETINKREDMFTLSSCSGRISLLNVKGRSNKKDSSWIIVTHDLADHKEFFGALEKASEEDKVEFKQECSILHICTKTIELAEQVIQLAKQCGFNRCGIIATKRKIVVELICSASLSTPVFDSRVLVREEYFNYLIEEANEKQKYSWQCINKLNKAFLEW